MCQTCEGAGAAVVRDGSCEHSKSPWSAYAQRVVQVEAVGVQRKLQFLLLGACCGHVTPACKCATCVNMFVEFLDRVLLMHRAGYSVPL